MLSASTSSGHILCGCWQGVFIVDQCFIWNLDSYPCWDSCWFLLLLLLLLLLLWWFLWLVHFWVTVVVSATIWLTFFVLIPVSAQIPISDYCCDFCHCPVLRTSNTSWQKFVSCFLNLPLTLYWWILWLLQFLSLHRFLSLLQFLWHLWFLSLLQFLSLLWFLSPLQFLSLLIPVTALIPLSVPDCVTFLGAEDSETLAYTLSVLRAADSMLSMYGLILKWSFIPSCFPVIFLLIWVARVLQMSSLSLSFRLQLVCGAHPHAQLWSPHTI